MPALPGPPWVRTEFKEDNSHGLPQLHDLASVLSSGKWEAAVSSVGNEPGGLRHTEQFVGPHEIAEVVTGSERSLLRVLQPALRPQ